MLDRLYGRTLSYARHRHALRALALVSFAESSFFPVPPDVMLIPMVLADRERAWRIATVCTIASVLGGLAGYAIGYFLFEALGQSLLALYGYAAEFTQFQARYNDYGAWIVFGAGLTPFPYKVITIASGLTRLDLGVFILASVLARGLRFYVEAALLWRYGAPIRSFIEQRLALLTTIFFALLLGGFLLIRYMA